ncbi:MAG: nucleotidyltransferase domain-containing protein [bacterium]|nr:nucleotidyltransferase domain-containing protein [bacterium]
MSKKSNEQFARIVEEAKATSDIIGCVLVGSRGKGFENEHSDYDAVLVVKDEVAKTFKDKYEDIELEDIDLLVMSLSEFKESATWGGPTDWDRYDYAHVKIFGDESGELKKISSEKGRIPEDKRHDFVGQSLDAYINAVFRSVKCFRNQNQTGARLEAAASVPYLLNVVFGINGRVSPFLGYLERELENWPLEKFSWSKDEFVGAILRILETADLKTQQSLLQDVEKFARKEGFGKVFDDWEGKDKWAMTFSPQ